MIAGGYRASAHMAVLRMVQPGPCRSLDRGHERVAARLGTRSERPGHRESPVAHGGASGIAFRGNSNS